MTSAQNRKATASQFARYLVVGGMNTAVTLLCIFILKSLLGVNPYLANAAGYIAGLVNSFLWNRAWVFRSSGHRFNEAVRFIIGFAACYLLQLFSVWFLTSCTPLGPLLWHIPVPFLSSPFALSGYGIATIVGMGIYTVANYIFNRTVTFR